MGEELRLDPVEARLLGVLVEKELTTPDQYPLSLNALIVGANQKSNRDPVMALGEAETRVCVEGLRTRHLVGAVAPGTGRVYRYKQMAGVHLALPVPLLATLAELLLRGAQSPGELRARVQRMAPVDSLEVLHGWLETLRSRGLVEELPPEPGERSPRWRQLLAPEARTEQAPRAAAPRGPAPFAAPPAPADARLATLEAEVARLRRQLEDLARALGAELSP